MKKLTTNEFIEKAIKVQGDKYDYSLLNYINNSTKIKINCLEHGEFKQRPSDHLSGSGCPICSYLKKAVNQTKTTNKFIIDAKKVHGDNFGYLLVNYVNARTKIKIICKEHGIFEQLPNNHLNGKGCPKCTDQTKTTNKFIIDAKKVHGDNFGYLLVNYVNARTKIKIICKEHGIFEQLPNNHLNGKGCPKCSYKIFTTEEFIEKVKNIHNNKYSYPNTNYINNKTKIKIDCPIHGEFEQRPDDHIRGIGCPFCKESHGEKEIRILLEQNNIIFETQKKFKNCRNKNQLPFDFYLPNINLIIEYDGEQHFKPLNFFGGKEGLKNRKKLDIIKNNFCKNSGIGLLRIKYNENIENKIKNYLKS